MQVQGGTDWRRIGADRVRVIRAPKIGGASLSEARGTISMRRNDGQGLRSDQHLRVLVDLLRQHELYQPADTLDRALDREQRIVALTVPDREGILRVHQECPYGLAELRGVLLKEHKRRLRQGL